MPKATDHNGYEQIIRPRREMEAGLKILVSALPIQAQPPDSTLRARIRLSDLRDRVDADEPTPLSSSQVHVRDVRRP